MLAVSASISGEPSFCAERSAWDDKPYRMRMIVERAKNQIRFRGLIQTGCLEMSSDMERKVVNRSVRVYLDKTKRIYFEGFDPGSE